jgi:polyribonucleotide 5'-hydroxyl-kinase
VRAAAALKVTSIPVTPDLEQALLAVSHAPVPEQLLTSNVAGFVHISSVDVATGRVELLVPTAAAMPGSYLVAGSIKEFLV